MFSVVITSTSLEWFMLFRVLECWSHNTQTYVALAKLGITTSVKVHRLTYLRKVVQVQLHSYIDIVSRAAEQSMKSTVEDVQALSEYSDKGEVIHIFSIVPF